MERCSFEQGLCSWVQGDKNSPGSEWSRHRADEAWPKLGPTRDHTLNSDAGTRLSNCSTSLPTVDALWMNLTLFQACLLPHLMVSYLHAGHYVIPPIRTSETSEIISRTLLPSSNCTVGILWLSFLLTDHFNLLDTASLRVSQRNLIQLWEWANCFYRICFTPSKSHPPIEATTTE